MSEGNLNIEHAPLVNTTFRARDARLTNEVLVSRDWTEGYATQVFFLDV